MEGGYDHGGRGGGNRIMDGGGEEKGNGWGWSGIGFEPIVNVKYVLAKKSDWTDHSISCTCRVKQPYTVKAVLYTFD